MLLQGRPTNVRHKNPRQSKQRRNCKQNGVPRPTLNDPAIPSETKSQSSIISIKITNARDADNVVIEWYRHYRNNKPFDHATNAQLLTMARRQSAGGGCRSVEIKKSYPCLRCKELNKSCDCARFKNLYRKIYGPTADETILVGMETLHSLVSSRCSNSQVSMKVNRPEDTIPERNNNRNDGRRGTNARRDYECPPTSDDAIIEIREINQSQSQSRRHSEEERRRERRDSGATRAYANNARGSRDSSNRVRQEFSGKPVKRETFDENPQRDTASMYSDLSKFVSSDGITNHLSADGSGFSLDSMCTNNNSVRSGPSELIAQNPSPLVSDFSHETGTETATHAENHSPDADVGVLCKPPNCVQQIITLENTHSPANTPLRISNQTDNGARRKNDNDESTNRHKPPKTLQPDMCVGKNIPVCPPVKTEPKNERNEDEIALDSKETASHCSESTKYMPPTPQLYPCILDSANYDQSTPLMCDYVVPYWEREKPYPTVRFISPTIPQIGRACAGADSHKSPPDRFQKTLDLVEYLLRPFPHTLNAVDNRDRETFLGSGSNSSLASSLRSAIYGAPRIVNLPEGALSEPEKNMSMYGTGQSYMPMMEPLFREHRRNDVLVPVNNNDILCFPFQFGTKKNNRESTNRGSVSPPTEPVTVEDSDAENTTTYSSTEQCSESISDGETTDLTQYSKEIRSEETYEINTTIQEHISSSCSSASTQQSTVDESVAEESTVHSGSLRDNVVTETTLDVACPAPASAKIDSELLRELNMIVHDRSARQALTPIPEVTEISETDLSSTETQDETKSLASETSLKLSAGLDTAEQAKVSEDEIKSAQSKVTVEYSGTIPDTTSESVKEDNDVSGNIDDSSRDSPVSEEIITTEPAESAFQYDSSAPSPTTVATCGCFGASGTESDEDESRGGKKKVFKDKQINTSPVRIARASKSQQTDPVKLRPIKKRVDSGSELAPETTSAATTSVSTVSVSSSKRRSSKSKRRSSSISKSIQFEQKSSKEDATGPLAASSVTRTAESIENLTDTRVVGDTAPSEPRMQRNLCPQETRYAIARITKYDEFTTYEILKSTRAKPRIIPLTTEGVFTVRNKKKRKTKL